MYQFIKNKTVYFLILLALTGCTADKVSTVSPMQSQNQMDLAFEEQVIAEFNEVRRTKGLPVRQITSRSNTAYNPYTPQIRKLGL